MMLNGSLMCNDGNLVFFIKIEIEELILDTSSKSGKSLFDLELWQEDLFLRITYPVKSLLIHNSTLTCHYSLLNGMEKDL